MKYYARQIAPEYQESPLSYSEIDTDYINITGNRDYTERVSLLFENVRDALYNGTILDEWEAINNHGRSLYYAWADALRDILPPSGRGEYTRAERLRIPEIASEYYYGADENECITDLLEIVTGQPWSCQMLSGCSQSEWVYAFYPKSAWNRAQLDAFECEYFNDGTEWEIDDGDFDPETDSPENINGYSVYCVTWNKDAQRQEIADAIGCDPSDVIMYGFTGYTCTACYKVVSA